MLQLLILTVVITYIYHLDAPNQIASLFANIITKGKFTNITLKKPFGCPLCITFWITLIILLCTCPHLWALSFVYAFLVKYIDYCISIVELCLDTIFMTLERLLNKIK